MSRTSASLRGLCPCPRRDRADPLVDRRLGDLVDLRDLLQVDPGVVVGAQGALPVARVVARRRAEVRKPAASVGELDHRHLVDGRDDRLGRRRVLGGGGSGGRDQDGGRCDDGQAEAHAGATTRFAAQVGESRLMPRAAQSIPPPLHGGHLGHVELGHVMADRAEEDRAGAVPARPGHRHLHALGPRGGLRMEHRRRQDVVGGVDVHVVLLGVHPEVREAGRDRALMVDDRHLVVLDAVGVGDELPADHELVVGRDPERVARAAVEAREADAALDGVQQRAQLRLGDLAHRPDRDDQVEPIEPVEQDVQGIRDLHGEPLVAEHPRVGVGERGRRVSLPAALDDQRVHGPHLVTGVP